VDSHGACTYSILPYHEKRLKEKAEAFIADESHYLKNPKAKRSVAAERISKKAKFTFLLTGTPIKNRPVEFVHQLKILGVLPSFDGAYGFKMRYCNPEFNGYGYEWNGASNLEELNMKLRAKCMVRRLKKDVMTELPPITHSEVPMDLNNRSTYDRAEANPIAFIYDEALNDKELWNEIAALLRDNGINMSVEEMVQNRALEKMNRASRAEHLVRIALLRKLAGQGKLDHVVKWVEDFLESSEEKLIVFAVHRAIQRELLQRFPDAAHVLGDDPGKVRMEQIDRFQDDPSCRLIVCSLYAASEGITLHAASNVAFVQQGWTPAEKEQAIARAHRIGQESDNVTVWNLEATDTIEQEIAALIERKYGYLRASADGDITAEADYVSTLKQLIDKQPSP
jgi:SNF2 family DNA or RNA helicase